MEITMCSLNVRYCVSQIARYLQNVFGMSLLDM